MEDFSLFKKRWKTITDCFRSLRKVMENAEKYVKILKWERWKWTLIIKIPEIKLKIQNMGSFDTFFWVFAHFWPISDPILARFSFDHERTKSMWWHNSQKRCSKWSEFPPCIGRKKNSLRCMTLQKAVGKNIGSRIRKLCNLA